MEPSNSPARKDELATAGEDTLGDLHSDVGTLRARVAELEEELDRTRNMLSEAERYTYMLEEEIGDKNAEIEEGKGYTARLKAEILDKNTEIERLGERVWELETAAETPEAERTRVTVRPCPPPPSIPLAAHAPGSISRTTYSLLRTGFNALPLPVDVKHRLRQRWAGPLRTALLGPDTRPDYTPPELQALAAEQDGSTGSAAAIAHAPADPKEDFRRVNGAALDAFLAGTRRLAMPRSDRPRVSVILILFNQAELTFACLRSICETPDQDLEVVIVDNASSDRTHELLGRLEQATIIENEENLQFLRACNQAARHASGEHLLFLNNDALLMPGSLSAALEVFDEEENLGAVGGRIVLLDGKLQEAGSIIWSDGSALGYGRGCAPDAGEFMFRRDVDYCSGAFLLTPRRLFADLDGFDETFAPAYYEETDYCMRIAERGLRVVYDPDAVILHLEFGSSGAHDASEQMRRNQALFVDKHRARLESHHLRPSPDNQVKARSANRDVPRLLYIDDKFPHLDLGQGFPRANSIIHELCALGLDVTIYATNQEPESWERIHSDLPKRVECLHGSRESGLATLLERRAGLYDQIYVSRPHNMEALRQLLDNSPDLRGGAQIIYDAEALFCLRDIAKLELTGKKVTEKEKQRLIRQETRLADIADTVITVSEQEGRHFDHHVSCERITIGHAMEPAPTSASFEERADFLFVGAIPHADTPNADSVLWFLDNVWPKVLEQLDYEPRFLVVGPNHCERILHHNAANLIMLGHVDDLRSIYNQARAVVVPTRYASGIPYKAHEAASYGVPLVCTELIANQLGWVDRHDLLCASHTHPAHFATHCINLYHKKTLWTKLRRNALTRVDTECTNDMFQSQIRASIAWPNFLAK